MISILYRTYRPGGFDILADSLKNQTMQDYELIVLDDYKPDRTKVIRDYLEEQNVNVAHVVPSKEKCFPWLPFNQNNQINTGILLSKGDIIIIYDDYTWVPPDHLEKFLHHKDKLKENYCITPINRMLLDHRNRNNDGLISIYDTQQIGSPLMNNCTFDFWHKPERFEVGGTAFPRGLLEEINGFPEYYDLYPSGLWRGIYKKMEGKAKYFVDHNIITEMINHRGWEPKELWHCSGKKAEYNSTAQAEHSIERENCFKLSKKVD